METRLTYIWHKNENKICLNFISVFEPLRFRHKYTSFLSKLASQIKLIQSVVGVSCWSQGPRVSLPGSQVSGSHVPGWQVPRLMVPVPESQGSSSQSLRSQGPGSQVSGPDFRLCLLGYSYKDINLLNLAWKQSSLNLYQNSTISSKKSKKYLKALLL